MSTPSHPLRLSSIQVLRGVAALLVVLYHLCELQRLALLAPGAPAQFVEDAALLAGPWRRGFAGVDLFFVISGFIMVYITAGLAPGWRQSLTFLRNRAIRVYPLWWMLCGLLVLYYFMATGQPVSADSQETDAPVGLYLLKSFLLIPQPDYPLLGVGWTLIHEMFFYILFAVLLFLKPKLRLVGLGIWCVVVIVGKLMNWGGLIATDYVTLALSLYSLEFIAGGFTAALILRGKIIFPRAALILGTTLAVIALFLFVEVEFKRVVVGRVLIFTLPFALMVYGAAGIEITRGIKATRFWVWLGDISYSLYLTHILILGVLIRAFPLLPLPQIGTPGYLDNLLFAVIGLVASIVVAALFYYCAERPLLRLMRGKSLSKSLAKQVS